MVFGYRLRMPIVTAMLIRMPGRDIYRDPAYFQPVV